MGIIKINIEQTLLLHELLQQEHLYKYRNWIIKVCVPLIQILKIFKAIKPLQIKNVPFDVLSLVN